MASGDKAPVQSGSDLDSLIHSLEFENQQYVKMIEKENQRLHYLQGQDEEKNSEINQLQSLTADLDSNTKRNHKQLVHNKNTLESLIKTKGVLVAHMDALRKQLELLQLQDKSQQDQFEETLQMYQTIWADYKAKYMSLPLGQTLASEEARLARAQVEHSHRLQQKQNLQQRIQVTKDELDFQNWHRFCIKIAEKKAGIEMKVVALNMALKEKVALQAQLREIQERHVPVISELDQQLDDQVMELDTGETDLGEIDFNESHSEDTTTTTTTDATTTNDTLMEDNVSSDKNKCGGNQDTRNIAENTGRHPPLNQTCTVKSGDITTKEPRNVRDDEREAEHVEDMGRQEPYEDTTRHTFVSHDRLFQPQISEANFMPETVRPPTLPPKNNQGNTASNNSEDPPCPQPADHGSNKKGGSSSLPLISLPRTPTRLMPPTKIPTVKSAVSAILTEARPSVDKALSQLPRTPLIVPRPVLPTTLKLLPRPELPGTPVIQPRPPVPSTPLLTPRLHTPSSPAPPQRGASTPYRTPVLQSPSCIQAEIALHNTDSSHRGASSRLTDGRGQGQEFAVPTLTAPSLQMPRLATGREGRGLWTLKTIPASPVPVVSGPVASAAQVSQLPRLVRPATTRSSAGSNQAGRQTSPGSGTSHSPPLLVLSDAGDSPHERAVTRSHPSNKESLESDEGGLTRDEDMETDTDTRSSLQCTPPAITPSQSKYPYSPFDLDKHQKKLRELRASPTYVSFTQRAVCTASSTTEKADVATSSSPERTPVNSPVFRLGFSSPSKPAQQPMSSLFSCTPSAIPVPDLSTATSPERSERGGSFFSFESMDTSDNSGGLSLLSMFGKSGQEQTQTEPAFSFNFGQSLTSGNDSRFAFSFGGSGGNRSNENQGGSLFSLF